MEIQERIKNTGERKIWVSINEHGPKKTVFKDFGI